MADGSKIEWTDATWNPVRGCTRVSQGCVNCYAEVMAARFSEPGQWGHGFATMKGGDHRWTGKVSLIQEQLKLPRSWKNSRKIFVNSTSDLFHEALTDEDIAYVFAAMASTHVTATADENNVITSMRQRHIYQVLTKRPQRMKDFVLALIAASKDVDTERWLKHPFSRASAAISRVAGDPYYMNAPLTSWQWVHDGLPGLWLGVSCEDQATADERIPLLLQTPAAVRFISAEPLLGPIDLTEIKMAQGLVTYNALRAGQVNDQEWHALDWVIVGGESGPNARPMHPDWARGLRDQCNAASIQFFFKQWGEWAPGNWHNEDPAFFTPQEPNIEPRDLSNHDAWQDRVHWFDEAIAPNGVGALKLGKKVAGRLLDGREWNEYPEIERERV